MAVTHGMNPEDVEGLGRQLQDIAKQIDSFCSTLNGRIGTTTWMGPDANTFKNDWWPQHQQHLINVASELHGFGQSALNNATEQRTVSGQ